MNPRCTVAAVLSNRALTPEIFQVVLRLPADWGPARPGQFVQVECPPRECFGLCRPFSLSAAFRTPEAAEIEIVYGIVGSRTRALSLCRSGETLAVIGPLGRPFREVVGRFPVLVGGGRGIAPLSFLAREISGATPAGMVLYGTRTAEQRVPLVGLPFPLHAATEDGSLGFCGTVVDLLDHLSVPPAKMAIFACGPNRMLEAVARWAVPREIPCQVSLETHFGCGFGICAGCAVPLQAMKGDTAFERYALACQDGPVMEADRVDWENWENWEKWENLRA